jgi:hypothetical protein
MGEKCPIKFSTTIATSTVIVWFYYMPQSCESGADTEGILRIFSPEKSDGFGRVEPANLGVRCQHANH